MPNSRFTPTEDTLAKQISREYQKKGVSKEEANRIGYATVTRMNNDKQFRSEVNKDLQKKSALSKVRNR